MPSAWTPIANYTLGASATSVTFSSITGSYRDLRLVVQGAAVTPYNPFAFRINGDSGANYAWALAYGNGSSASSSSNGSDTYGRGDNDYMSSNQSNIILDFLDYSATDKHKIVLVRTNYPSQGAAMVANRWANTAAINSIRLSEWTDSVHIAAGTTFALYGVSA